MTGSNEYANIAYGKTDLYSFLSKISGNGWPSTDHQLTTQRAKKLCMLQCTGTSKNDEQYPPRSIIFFSENVKNFSKKYAIDML